MQKLGNHGPQKQTQSRLAKPKGQLMTFGIPSGFLLRFFLALFGVNCCRQVFIFCWGFLLQNISCVDLSSSKNGWNKSWTFLLGNFGMVQLAISIVDLGSPSMCRFVGMEIPRNPLLLKFQFPCASLYSRWLDANCKTTVCNVQIVNMPI